MIPRVAHTHAHPHTELLKKGFFAIKVPEQRFVKVELDCLPTDTFAEAFP